jgi:hypothetical protein
MDTSKAVSLRLPLFSEIFSALPDEWHTSAIREKLLAAYRHELHCLVNIALRPDCQKPCFVMLPWRQEQGEWVCDFWVADEAQPPAPVSRWHGQDTSQWRHGGSIVVFRGHVSTNYCPL